MQELKEELEVIASVELQQELENWGAWNEKEKNTLRAYLLEEMSYNGMLSVEKGRESGQPMGRIRQQGRLLLKTLEGERA
jgi:hypothetical protein